MKAIDVITHLMKVLNLTPNKDLQSGSTQHISAYGSFPVGNGLCLIRVADHNTFLYNWIDRNQNIDLTTSANYAITFVDEIPFHGNPNKENNVNAINPPDVIVRQYVYNLTALSDDEVTHVMDECIKLAQTGVFTDPLEEDDVKHAIIYRHRTNQPTVDMTSKTRKSHRKKKSAQNKITTSQTTQTTENNKTDKNESKNMNRKNTIRLTENKLKKVISESVRKVLNEIGDTNRGQYMLGRLHRRHNTDADYLSGVDSQARKFNKGNWEVFDQGYNDEGISNALDKSNTIRRNYGVYKMNDMDKVGKKFIDFIEKNDLALQLIVDYMSGNQNGEKYSSPLPELIPQFENEVLGHECSEDMRKAIERAFNEWWNYAESSLMPEEMYESQKYKKSIKLTESELKRIITESVKRIMNETILGFNTDEDEKEALMKYSRYGYPSAKDYDWNKPYEMDRMWRDRKRDNPFLYDEEGPIGRLKRMEYESSSGRNMEELEKISPEIANKVKSELESKFPGYYDHTKAVYQMDKRNN